MLPFDRKPWAKAVATLVIVLAFAGAAWAAFYFYSNQDLHISEVVGIFLLLLTVVPPNAAIIFRKPGETDPMVSHKTFSHTR